MNSNFNNFDFDLGIRSNTRSSNSLNQHRNKSNSNSNSYSYSTSTTSYSQPTTTPSWTHQPAPSQPAVTRTEFGGPPSMVGDIMGKNWNSTTLGPQKAAVTSSIGIVSKNPDLFGDLLNSALGQNKGSSNVPLKNVTPVKDSFSMGAAAGSLPKTSNASGSANLGGGVAWGSYQSSGSGTTSNASINWSSGLGGPSLGGGGGSGGVNLSNDPFGSFIDFSSKPMKDSVVGGSSGGDTEMNSNKDPFGSFVDFSLKPMEDSVLGSSSHGSTGMNSNKDPFGSFVDFSSNTMRDSVVGGVPGIGVAGKATAPSEDFHFGDFQNASKSNPLPFSPEISNPLGSNSGSISEMDVFVDSTGADLFDMFVSVSASGSANAASRSGGGDDWGFDSGIGGHDDGGTTELDGLPPPPAGVSSSAAKAKGLDNYRQGQFADAIKWLSWAEVLLKKAGETASTEEVLLCRASCYKEVGEYKKAVADCTKILDDDGTNVGVLVQRALLYESMEKYRLGAEDLRTVMKLDPGNRVARSTIHRLNKMAD